MSSSRFGISNNRSGFDCQSMQNNNRTYSGKFEPRKSINIPVFVRALLIALYCYLPFDGAAQPHKVPPFRILQTNGKVFNAANLPFGKPILLIYFSPDCDHCQVMMKEWFSKADSFKKASVVMVTFLSIEKVKAFEEDYKLKRYSNIIAGTEGLSFFVRNYYKIADMPFAALYNKNGDLVVSYQKNIPLNELAGKLKKL